MEVTETVIWKLSNITIKIQGLRWLRWRTKHLDEELNI